RMTGSVSRLDATGIMKRFRDSGCLQPDDADPQGTEFAGPLTAEAFDGVECDSSATYLGDGLARRRGGDRPDDARSARGHLPPRDEISLATLSRVARVLPARKTRAPSRAKAPATAAPIAPPAP